MSALDHQAREHIERLRAMAADDKGWTWDLSGNDRAALAWALAEIERLREFEFMYRSVSK